MTSTVTRASLNAVVFHMAESVKGGEKFDISFNTATPEGLSQFVKAFAEMRWAQEDYSKAKTPEEKGALVKYNEHSSRIGSFYVDGVKISSDALVGVDKKYWKVDNIVAFIKAQKAENEKKSGKKFELAKYMTEKAK